MNLDIYQLPASLKIYLEESKSIQSKISEPILEGMEDNYLRFTHFYNFNEEQFSEIAVDCLYRYKSVESFTYMMNQTLKSNLEFHIKGSFDMNKKIKESIKDQYKRNMLELYQRRDSYKKYDEKSPLYSTFFALNLGGLITLSYILNDLELDNYVSDWFSNPDFDAYDYLSDVIDDLQDMSREFNVKKKEEEEINQE